MKIAIFDIDDTIVEETAFMLENAPRFLKKKYNIDAQVVNPNGYDLKEVYDLAQRFRQLGCNSEQAAQKANYVNQEFWNRNFARYCSQPIRKGVKETVELLRSEGYKIVFLSLRGKRKDGKQTIKERIKLFFVYRLTAAQLHRGKIRADIIRLVKNKEEKLEYIRAMNPNIVFEDRADIVQEISTVAKVFCVNTPHNEKVQFNSNVIRIDSFDMQKVKNAICRADDGEPKKQTLLQKRLTHKKCIRNRDFIPKGLTEFVYSAVCIIGRPIALRKYRPIVIGAENIPKRGSVVFAGNHRNKLDPVLIGATSPRRIHWGALLRMFQGKENLFNSTTKPIPCHLSAAFITAMGAVPIARKTDTDYLKINMESIRKLCQILIWGGAAGLFPEGTLNRRPEECNILPLKSDRVFKMAMDTDSLIIPVSVVWLPEELNVKNKVIISYGMPINSRNKTAHELSELWQEAVNYGIEAAKEMIDKNQEVEKLYRALKKETENL